MLTKFMGMVEAGVQKNANTARIRNQTATTGFENFVTNAAKCFLKYYRFSISFFLVEWI